MNTSLASFTSVALLTLVALASTAACSGGSGSSASATNPTDAATVQENGGDAASGAPTTNDGGIASGMSANGALKIVSVTTTTSTLTGGTPLSTETASVTFVAIVTDVQGLDNIAGGTLTDDVGTTYGSFGTGSTKGTYSSSVSWTQLNEGRAIEFALGTPAAQRKLVARFFDNDGNVAEALVTIALQCRADATTVVGACAGACVDLSAMGEHCGACGVRCDKGKVCTSGTCVAATFESSKNTSCFARSAVAKGTTCADVCSAAGRPSCDGTVMNPTATCDPMWDTGGLECSDPLTGPAYSNAPYFSCLCK